MPLKRFSDSIPASKDYPDDATSKTDQQDKATMVYEAAITTTTTTTSPLGEWAKAALASGSWKDALIAVIDVRISILFGTAR